MRKSNSERISVMLREPLWKEMQSRKDVPQAVKRMSLGKKGQFLIFNSESNDANSVIHIFSLYVNATEDGKNKGPIRNHPHFAYV